MNLHKKIYTTLGCSDISIQLFPSKKYLEAISGKEHVDIEVLGRTATNKPLYMIVVSNKGIPDNSKKGVLVYAREHYAWNKMDRGGPKE